MKSKKVAEIANSKNRYRVSGWIHRQYTVYKNGVRHIENAAA